MNLRILSVLIVLLTKISFDVILAAKNITLLDNVYIEYQNYGNKTDFMITSPLGKNDVFTNNSWIALGFNSLKQMVFKYHFFSIYLIF